MKSKRSRKEERSRGKWRIYMRLKQERKLGITLMISRLTRRFSVLTQHVMSFAIVSELNAASMPRFGMHKADKL
jgi:hypothetical protein